MDVQPVNLRPHTAQQHVLCGLLPHMQILYTTAHNTTYTIIYAVGVHFLVICICAAHKPAPNNDCGPLPEQINP
jgi:hypothetical protein